MVHVKVTQGQLKGNFEKLSSGNSYVSFKGIPYAAPPIGKHRFKAPLSPLEWDGVRDATVHGNICPQVEMPSGIKVESSEDCLFLNVYTPSINEKLLPVMVWFHGGGFYTGSGDSSPYGPDYIVEEGVILVTVNYRLEVLGFLCLDTKEVPGNAGLKDQVAALRWIRENIKYFGGDNSNVTIFGGSAGGASVSYHMVSPMSQGLFKNAIIQSGCFLQEWCSPKKPVERAFRLGKALGLNTTNVNDLHIFLMNIPAREITKVTKLTITYEEKIRGLPTQFGPTVEKKFDGEECFLYKSPREILEHEDFSPVPTLIGYNNKEGMIFIKNSLKKAQIISNNFERRIHRDIVQNVTSEKLKKIAADVKHFYFGDRDLSTETVDEIIDLESDYNFTIAIIEFAKILGRSARAPIYLYRFSFDDDSNNIGKTSYGLNEYKGACHGDEVSYIFKTNNNSNAKKKIETELAIRRTVKLWTNFAKFGNPTPSFDETLKVIWQPYTDLSPSFLDIGFELIPGKDPEKKRFELWMKISNNVRQKNKMILSKI